MKIKRGKRNAASAKMKKKTLDVVYRPEYRTESRSCQIFVVLFRHFSGILLDLRIILRLLETLIVSYLGKNWRFGVLNAFCREIIVATYVKLPYKFTYTRFYT